MGRRTDDMLTKKKITKYFYNYLVSLSVIVGCGTWTGNPDNPEEDDEPTNQPTSPVPVGDTTASLTIQGSGGTSLIGTTVAVTAADGSSLGTLVLDIAKLSLKEIKLKRDSDDSESEYEFKGPFVVDLLTNTMTPNADTIAMEQGVYQDIQLKLHKLEKDDAEGISEDDPIVERSIYLKGSYVNGDTTKAFELSFEFDEEFSLKDFVPNPKGFTITKGKNPIVIAFNMARWFDFSDEDINEEGVDFSGLSAGSIILSKDTEETEKKIYETIRDAIKKSARFGKDEDEDGKLEKTEDNDDDNDEEEEEEEEDEDEEE